MAVKQVDMAESCAPATSKRRRPSHLTELGAGELCVSGPQLEGTNFPVSILISLLDLDTIDVSPAPSPGQASPDRPASLSSSLAGQC